MIYEKTDNFFIQKVNIENIIESRFPFFESLCKGKRTLHVGCADAMTFSVDNNLHLFLSKKIEKLVGFDIDVAGLKKLKEICPGEYFSSFSDCSLSFYDIVIIPEVLEHISNVKDFLDEIFSLDAKEIVISVPNIIHYGKEMIQDEHSFTEIVHPDHKCWFSPYTIFNTVRKYIKDESKCKMYYLEGKSMVAIHIVN